MILLLFDTSAKVMYENARTEKMIQSVINATVSHEIRNPINAIQSQNAMLEMLNKKVSDLIEYVRLGQLSFEDFIK